jgi:hypothetical protein
MFQKQTKDSERLFLQLKLDAILAQFACPNVYLEDAEATGLRKLRLDGHHAATEIKSTPVSKSRSFPA